jgi:RNA polymerase sigma factor (sigma-70 family)
VEKLAKFRGQAKFSTYVHRIAINLANLELRKRDASRKRFRSLDEESVADADSPLKDAKPLDRSDDFEQKLLLNSVKRGLSARESALIDCLLYGMTTRETAEQLGISEDAAESLRRRVLKKVKKKLNPYDGK